MSQENASHQDSLEDFQIENINKIIASYDLRFMNMEDSRQTAAYENHKHYLVRDIFTNSGPPIFQIRSQGHRLAETGPEKNAGIAGKNSDVSRGGPQGACFSSTGKSQRI